MSGSRIGIEVGGTFTDWVVAEGGRVVRAGKVLSTPANPEVGAMDALQEAAVPLDELTALIHGSTVATNVVLERKGAATALITTAGFRDVLAIQRQAKQRLFDLFYKQPTPLVSRDHVLEVVERVMSDGTVAKPLDLDGIPECVTRLVTSHQIESIAVCLLHSYANAQHERTLEQAISSSLPGLCVSLSSDVLPQFREYERCSTVVMSAYTRPIVDRYLGRLEERLAAGGFRGHLSVIQANGGSVPASAIRRHAVRMILSGPAAGVVGATAVATAARLDNILTFDMGGTSTDVCLVDGGKPKITTDYKIAGLPLALPMIDVVTVGAGGGSIAAVDKGAILAVGPESAGADPGPACYGRGGGAFTVTDANVVLGFIRPHAFYGGKLRLDPGAALAALDRLAAGLRMSRMEAAGGVRQLVNSVMAQAMRLVSVERGHDPRDYAIVAYGGGGPLHAAQLAEELGCPQVLVPYNPGILSAFGLLIADTQQDFVVTRISPAGSMTRTTLLGTFEALEARAQEEFERYGIAWAHVDRRYFLDMRYVGQAYELTMPIDEFADGRVSLDMLAMHFHRFHKTRYGHASGRASVEIVNFRLTALHRPPLERVNLAPLTIEDGLTVERAPVLLDGRMQQCAFFRREKLPAGFEITGPSVIEETTATTFVPSCWRATVDPTYNLVLRRA